MTHICVGKLTIIGSDNGLSPERCQAIIWTNAGTSLRGPLGTNFNEMSIEIQTFSMKKIRLKMSYAECCSLYLGLNELIVHEDDMTWKRCPLYWFCERTPRTGDLIYYLLKARKKLLNKQPIYWWSKTPIRQRDVMVNNVPASEMCSKMCSLIGRDHAIGCF